MTRKRLERTREVLHEMILSNDYDPEEILKKSQELDQLVLQALRESHFYKEVLEDKDSLEYGIILDRAAQFKDMYESMRMVDPYRKAVLDLKPVGLAVSDFKCYEFWERNTSCENCISIRAYNENEIFFKLEYNQVSTYIVTAIPIHLQGKRLVVELLKDVSSNIQPSRSSKDDSHVLSAIDHMNQRWVKDERTDFYNSRFIRERLPVDLLKASMENRPLSILLLEMDPNKALPHDKQRGFIHTIQRHIPKDEHWIAKYSEEALMICLTDTDRNSAKIIARNMREDYKPARLEYCIYSNSDTTLFLDDLLEKMMP